MLAIRLPNEIETRLAALAKVTGRSKSYYVREMITQNLDDLEKRYLTHNMRMPNAITLAALDEAQNYGNLQRVNSVEELFDALNADE